MNLNAYVFSVTLAMCLLLSGCGEDKIIYDNGFSNTSTATNTKSGKTLFDDTCSGCHTAASLSGTTVASIKNKKDMSYGLTDAQLQLVVDYLATTK